MSTTYRGSKNFGKRREFVQSPEYRPYHDIIGKQMEFVCEIYVGETTIEILE